VKESAKYVVTLGAFIAGAFVLSWCAVYSFWLAAHIFRSVQAVRIGDALGSVILLPARIVLQFSGGLVDQSTLLTNPLLYATINAALLGILAYACCRRWIFTGGG
jgi:hypothetical protein